MWLYRKCCVHHAKPTKTNLLKKWSLSPAPYNLLAQGSLWNSMKWKWNMKFLIPWLLTTQATPGPCVFLQKKSTWQRRRIINHDFSQLETILKRKYMSAHPKKYHIILCYAQTFLHPHIAAPKRSKRSIAGLINSDAKPAFLMALHVRFSIYKCNLITLPKFNIAGEKLPSQ